MTQCQTLYQLGALLKVPFAGPPQPTRIAATSNKRRPELDRTGNAFICDTPSFTQVYEFPSQTKKGTSQRLHYLAIPMPSFHPYQLPNLP